MRVVGVEGRDVPDEGVRERLDAVEEKRAAPGLNGASGTPSGTRRKKTGAPVTLTLTVAVTWSRVHRVNARRGTFRHSVLEVDTAVVVQAADWRSSWLPSLPSAASTRTGAATSSTTAGNRTRSLRRLSTPRRTTAAPEETAVKALIGRALHGGWRLG